MTFSCIVVDDDFFAVEQLEEYILKMPLLSMASGYTDSVIAAKEIKDLERPIDFLFCDVEMPNLCGLTLAKLVQHQVKNLILVSANSEHFLAGYGVEAKGFLTKPFTYNKFEKIINRQIASFNRENPFIWVNSGKKTEIKLYLNRIIAIEGNGNYINIHTLSKVFVLQHKLSDIELELNHDRRFKRISKSFIISTQHIEKKNGDLLELKKGIIIKITGSYRRNFEIDN